MSETNKSFRIRTNVNSEEQYVNIDFTQTYDKIEILSLEINQSNSYRLMNSNTGVIVGRVLANEGFGIPNAKVSVFVKYDNTDDFNSKLRYHYTSTLSTNDEGVRYNLLPDSVSDMCQQSVGSFPSKRYVLDNNDVINVFDKYYTYTTRTNNSGDYMIYGVPTGQQTVHCDIDLSDIGVLSQTPRDMIYKGYDINLFESPNKFKSSTDLNSLAQIKSQDTPVFVYPFWGDTTDDLTGAAVTRCDINISYKFEPTCVFIGSIMTDTNQNALSKKCVPSKLGGKMSEMTSGPGMIEMIRKTVNGDVEQVAIKGNEVINEDGVWCYQIPMNLDYVMTDEYGNTVLSDNPNKGIATRARVRFRVSMHENPADGIASKRARYLVPNNPHLTDDYPEFISTKDVDYEFGSKTKDENFRDLMWNNVYTVKNYIPRIQKAKLPNNLKFLGVKMTNHSGKNNPMPYNKLSIKFNFLYTFLCVLIKVLIQLTRVANIIINAFQWVLIGIAHGMVSISNRWFWPTKLTVLAGIGNKTPDNATSLLQNIEWSFPSDNITYSGCANIHTITVGTMNDGAIKGLAGISEIFNPNRDKINRASWCAVSYFLWVCCKKGSIVGKWNLINVMKAGKIQGLAALCCALVAALGRGIALEGLCETEDGDSLTVVPGPDKERSNFLTYIDGAPSDMTCFKQQGSVAELYNCVENQLAQENEVTSFNFYNDWVNGVLYLPLWYRKIKPKRRFLFVNLKGKDQWCNGNETAIGSKRRKLKVYTNCVVKRTVVGTETLKPLNDDYVTVNVPESKANDETGREDLVFKPNKIGEDNCYGFNCHKLGRSETPIYSGVIVEKETMLGDKVYYYKPVYKSNVESDLTTLFATDIVLLGSLKNCDLHGIPQFFKILESTSFQMPPDLMSEDYEYLPINDTDNELNTDENERLLIDESTRRTEYTGADWGNLGVDQSNYKNGKYEANENIYDNGGLFYGITCFDSYTKPKSVINLERICEIGVSLDEAQDFLADRNSVKPNGDVSDEESLYSTLTPDGYISYDDIYNPDYRSMFATLNGNFLKTKVNIETGLTEYDLTHVYVDNFDGSLSNIMAGPATHGNLIVNGIDTHVKSNYINNSKLEVNDLNYTRFRFGNYVKKNGKKLYFYEYDGTLTRKNKQAIKAGSKFPRYENSFYFYFGLNQGKTAIDKFYEMYYSDCAVEDTFEKPIDIQYVGNSWCYPYDGGYIKFKCGFDLPLNIRLTDIDEPANVYSATDIKSNRFYIGAENDDAGQQYLHVKVDYSNDSTDELLSYIKHGNYRIEIIDGNGTLHETNLVYTNDDKIQFNIEKYDFNLNNESLLNRYSYTEDNYSVRLVKHNEHGDDSVIANALPYTILGSSYNGTPQCGYTKYGVIEMNYTTGERNYMNASGFNYHFDFSSDELLDVNGTSVAYTRYNCVKYIDGNGLVLAEKNSISTQDGIEIVFDLMGYDEMIKTDLLSKQFYETVADDGKTWITQTEYNSLSDDEKLYYTLIKYKQGNSSIDVYDRVQNNEQNIRDIYGYVIISDVTYDNFRIRVEPANNGLPDFIGYECVVYNGNIEIGGFGHLGVDNIHNRYYIGLPYGNMNYKVTLTMLCEDEDERVMDSANQTITYVTVYDGSFKMYINGIDYDLIRYFRTGWSDKHMNAVTRSTFNTSAINGWNDVENIGLNRDLLDNYYPLVPEINFNTTIAVSVEEYNAATGMNLTEEEFNDLDNKSYVSVLEVTEASCELINNLARILMKDSVYTQQYSAYRTDTPYNWNDEFVIDKNNWNSMSDSVDALKDSEGRNPVDAGYEPTFSGDIYDKCAMINDVIDARIDLTKQMIGAFRPNVNGVTEIIVTGKTKSTPVQYLMVTDLIKVNNPLNNLPGISIGD